LAEAPPVLILMVTLIVWPSVMLLDELTYMLAAACTVSGIEKSGTQKTAIRERRANLENMLKRDTLIFNGNYW